MGTLKCELILGAEAGYPPNVILIRLQADSENANSASQVTICNCVTQEIFRALYYTADTLLLVAI